MMTAETQKQCNDLEFGEYDIDLALLKNAENNCNDLECGEYDIDPALLKNAVTDMRALAGTWQLVKERSESHDKLMQALGIPYVKRAIVKNATTSTVIHDLASDGRPYVFMISHLPMGRKKEGKVYIDGAPFSYNDSDTGEWVTRACIAEGRIIQKRVHKEGKGVMFDVRATFLKDPLGIMKDEDGPFQCFKWGYEDHKGKRYIAHRWFRRIGQVSTSVTSA